jgi:hypothetical protein
MALKRTNPSRTSVDAVVSAIEMRELPRLVKQTFSKGLDGLFRHLPKGTFNTLGRAGKINLMVQFGIMPMIGDIKKLIKFQESVDSRVKELKRLQERGLRRTVKLGDYSASKIERDVFLNSQGGIIKGDIHTFTTVVVKGHVRWRVSKNFYVSESDLQDLVIEILTNRSLDPYAIYELMPWSWLIDYFVNLGDFVSLSRNVLDARYETPRIMKHTQTYKTSRNVKFNGGDCKFIDIYNHSETKLREIVPAHLDAQIGFLSGNQLSILGSLAVSKGRR